MKVKLYDYLPRDECNETIVIHTGLSLTVRGHLIDLYRDEVEKVATIRVTMLSGHVLTGFEWEDIKKAADLLAKRAQRFFGEQWTIVRWEPPDRPFGYLTQGSGA